MLLKATSASTAWFLAVLGDSVSNFGFQSGGCKAWGAGMGYDVGVPNAATRLGA